MKTLSHTLLLTFIAGLLLSLASTAQASTDVSAALDGAGFGDKDLPTGPVVLNFQAQISGEVVLLGDLFENAGAKADKAVVYAPRPGRKTVYNAKWLYRVARYYGLDWKPTTSRDRITIIRDSITVGYNDIVEAVMTAFEDENIPNDMLAEISNRSMKLYLPADIFPEIAVEDLVYDNRSKRFSAIIVAPANHPAAQRHRVTGKLYKMIDIPVLKDTLRAGDSITKNNLEWQSVRSEKITNDTITSVNALIGMTPRRTLRAGNQIRSTEVRYPVLIQRRSLVTISLVNNFMTLTIQGRALENGSRGDMIRITNIQSKQIIDAEVVGPGKARVRVPSIMAMN